MFFYQKAKTQAIAVPDSIVVYTIDSNKLVFDYTVHPGNTVYSISRTFDTKVKEIYSLNDELERKPLAVGQTIKIPFNKDILCENDKCQNKKKIYYRVGKKENLFRIAKIYFGRNVSEISKINGIENYIIHPGQILLIGKFGTDNSAKKMLPAPIKKNDIKKTGNKLNKEKIVKEKDKNKGRDKMKFIKTISDTTVIVRKKSVAADTLDTVEDEKIEMATDSGKAIWNKNIHLKGIFVLNNDAKLNSLMEIYNPLVDEKIYARVIGRIPPNTYPDNVIIILSPQAAAGLKAIDDSFFVRINYIKK